MRFKIHRTWRTWLLIALCMAVATMIVALQHAGEEPSSSAAGMHAPRPTAGGTTYEVELELSD